VSGAAVGMDCLERRCADGGAGGKEAVGCMAHAQVAGDRGGGGGVRGVDSALGRLRVEAEGSCEGGEGGEGLHGGSWGTCSIYTCKYIIMSPRLHSSYQGNSAVAKPDQEPEKYRTTCGCGQQIS
jgi:hypothetical protein